MLKEQHLKLWLSHPNVPFTLEAIWFGVDFDKLDSRQIHRANTRIHLLYELGKNEYNQKVSIQLMVKNGALLTN